MSSDVSDTKYQLTTKRRIPLLNHACCRNEVSIETDVSRAWTSLLKMPVNYSFQGSGFICSKTNKKFCARFRSSHTIWDKIFQDKSDGRQTFQEESYYNFLQTYVFLFLNFNGFLRENDVTMSCWAGQDPSCRAAAYFPGRTGIKGNNVTIWGLEASATYQYTLYSVSELNSVEMDKTKWKSKSVEGETAPGIGRELSLVCETRVMFQTRKKICVMGTQ